MVHEGRQRHTAHRAGGHEPHEEPGGARHRLAPRPQEDARVLLGLLAPTPQRLAGPAHEALQAAAAPGSRACGRRCGSRVPQAPARAPDPSGRRGPRMQLSPARAHQAEVATRHPPRALSRGGLRIRARDAPAKGPSSHCCSLHEEAAPAAGPVS